MSEMSHQELKSWFLRRRGIGPHEEPCHECGGRGVKSYGCTSTWRGGPGGQAITTDVCDQCWGSGKENHPWPSHRKFDEMKRKLDNMEGEDNE